MKVPACNITGTSAENKKEGKIMQQN